MSSSLPRTFTDFDEEEWRIMGGDEKKLNRVQTKSIRSDSQMLVGL